jgi:hypothetical protein
MIKEPRGNNSEEWQKWISQFKVTLRPEIKAEIERFEALSPEEKLVCYRDEDVFFEDFPNERQRLR